MTLARPMINLAAPSLTSKNFDYFFGPNFGYFGWKLSFWQFCFYVFDKTFFCFSTFLPKHFFLCFDKTFFVFWQNSIWRGLATPIHFLALPRFSQMAGQTHKHTLAQLYYRLYIMCTIYYGIYIACFFGWETCILHFL